MTILDMMEAQLQKQPSAIERKEKPGRNGLHPALKLAPLLANLLDAYTTDQRLNQGGVREGNPIMAPLVNNDIALYGSKALIGLLTGLMSNELANKGGLIKKPHPKLGKAMAGASTALPLGAAAWNATR